MIDQSAIVFAICVAGIIGMAHLALCAWREDRRNRLLIDGNVFEVRIILTQKEPVRKVVQNYPDHGSFRSELFWHIQDRQVLRFEAFPLTARQIRQLRKEGAPL